MRIVLFLFGLFSLATCDGVREHLIPEMEEPVATATPSPTATPQLENPACPDVTMDCEDGFLWKPISDTTGNLVVLFPSRFVVIFDEVRVTRADDKEENLAFSSIGNGDRQHWRGSLPGNKYKKNSLVIARKGEEYCFWEIKRPSRRCE